MIGVHFVLRVPYARDCIHSLSLSCDASNQFDGASSVRRNCRTELHTISDMAPPTAPDSVHNAISQVGVGPGDLLPILHRVQDALGHIPAASVELIAAALNLSRAEVHGVVTYYPHFRSLPPGKHVIQVCRAEACKAMGADDLWERACNSLAEGVDAEAGHGITTTDGRCTLEPVFCLGLCASSPAITVNSTLHARVTAEKLDRVLAATVGPL